MFRGFAALAVVLYHVTARYDQLYGHPEPLAVMFTIGPYGVHLFFLVSGFVILMTLQRSPSPFRFAYTRFLRVFPAYWASVVFAFVVLHLGTLPIEKPGLTQTFANFFLFQHFFGIKYVDGVYWSLVVEVMFYITIFFVLCFRLVDRVRLFCWGWLGVVATLFLAESLTGNIPWPVFDLLTLKYAHLFITGMTLYRIHSHGWDIEKLLLLVACCLTEYLLKGGVGAMVIAFFMVAFTLAQQGWLNWINRKPLLYLGTISYSLYLVHQNLSYTIMHHLYELGYSSVIAILVAIACSIVVAVIFTHAIEQPVANVLKKKFEAILQKKEIAKVSAKAVS